MGRKRGKKTKRKSTSGKARRPKQAVAPRKAHAGAAAIDIPPVFQPLDDLERRLPPTYFDHARAPIPDPWEVLGLASGESDPEVVRSAWREAMARPQVLADPDRGHLMRRCRDWLISPEAVIERSLGGVQLPDPAAWSLPLPDGSDSEEPRLPARVRLLGQLMLTVLAEDALLDK